TFRSGGRFFLPVYYFLLIMIFLYLEKRIASVRYRAVLLSVCLLLQGYDLRGFFKPTGRNYSDQYTPPINNQVWDEIVKSFDAVIFYPGLRGGLLDFHDYRYFGYYAVLHHKKINAGYIP